MLCTALIPIHAFVRSLVLKFYAPSLTWSVWLSNHRKLILCLGLGPCGRTFGGSLVAVSFFG
jgi:hypothetical protein